MTPLQAGTIKDIIDAFTSSDIRFNRSVSDVPFLPLAFFNARNYQKNQLQADGLNSSFSYQQTNVSQAAMLPWLIDSRNALLVGEYLSFSSFDSIDISTESFDVYTAGLPMGWFQQANPEWQYGGFVFPLYHQSSLPNATSSLELMGGAFARYYQSDELWWVFGFFADQSPTGDIYLPYVGASLALDKHWTLSAVMPWPAILYAPQPDILFRLGVMPSDALWTLQQNSNEVSMSLGGWDFGFSVEYRIKGNYWTQFEVGVAGFQALKITGGEFDGAQFDGDTGGFIAISLNYRPSL